MHSIYEYFSTLKIKVTSLSSQRNLYRYEPFELVARSFVKYVGMYLKLGKILSRINSHREEEKMLGTNPQPTVDTRYDLSIYQGVWQSDCESTNLQDFERG